MNLNDWYDTGENIKQAVQDAVDTQDFSNLSRQIGSIFGLGGTQTNQTQRPRTYTEHRTQSGVRTQGNPAQGNQGRYAGREGGYSRDPRKINGMVTAVLGYAAAAVFAFLLLCVQAIGYFYWVRVGVTSFLLFVLMIAALAVGYSGGRKWSLASRFERYSRIIGNRTFCRVIEISSVVRRSEKSVVRDLKAMIKKGYFPEGHLDKKETCFITDSATYQQYLTAQSAYEERLAEERKSRRRSKKKVKEEEAREAAKREQAERLEKEARAREDSLSPECRELLEEGRGYIRHIRECNDRIPGEEMTDKLHRLEQVTARIFAEAERNPEVIGDLKKMMNYYLPTTAKLLDAYVDLDAQPVQGPNIVKTKREIEQSVDTINEAFANLLDSLFEDTAWDISSDISVLQTMLAQEGLTGSDFDKKHGAGA